LRSCIAGPVLTSGTACLRPISRPSFGASSTSTWTPSMRPSSSATIQACVACRWRLEAHRGQAAGAAADVHHAVTVCEAAKLHQQRCQPPAPLSHHHPFIGVGIPGIECHSRGAVVGSNVAAMTSHSEAFPVDGT